MKKKLLFWWILLSCITQTFALQANISVNQNNLDINKPLTLKINIKWEWEKNIWISKINWIENFQILWKNQSQFSSVSQTVINWKTTMKAITNYILNLTLQAKKAWTYIIWPVFIEADWKKYKTNTVKVNISWAKIMLNNTNTSLPSNNNSLSNQKNNLLSNTNSPPNADNLDLEKNVKKIKIDSSLNIFYILLLLFILIWWWIVFYIFNKNEVIENNEEIKNILKNETDKKSEEEKVYNLDEVKNLEEFENYVRYLISKKYGIEDVKYKSYSELASLVDDENIKNLLYKLEQIKYAWLSYELDELKSILK